MAQVRDRKQLILSANWLLIIFTLILGVVGVANLYSASATRMGDGMRVATYYARQIGWMAVGIAGMVMCMFFDYRKFAAAAWPLYILSVVMLLLVFSLGTLAGGAQRWISFGLFNFQPSEMAKFAVMLLSAKMMSKGKEPMGWLELLRVLAMGLVPAALTIMQPDLGTGLIIVLILGGMILFRGVNKQILLVGLVVVLVSPVVVWKVVVPNLHPYQRERIETFLDPTKEDKDAAWQGNQSQIAIGSGQMVGKGYLEGTQSKLRFLPAKHTDFAIAVYGEEWGFVGSVTLVALFCMFLLSIFSTARDSRDRFGSIFSAGVYFYFFWQILINIGMVLGMLPVVGVPLPFISYGGSATVVNFCLLGIVLSVSMRRSSF